MHNFIESLPVLLLLIAVAVGVFLALRWVMLWYYGINEIHGYQTDQLAALNKTNKLLESIIEQQAINHMREINLLHELIDALKEQGKA